ncbi:MAG TPA: hypothetical protein VMR81_00705 [Patescibacteria group bacterium]|jgi:hypothetical protein|nr:hypothetical protein [Patescibacteria group bacterium]
MKYEDGGFLRVLGWVWQGEVEKRLEALPNNTFDREGLDIYYKDKSGKIRTVLQLDELDRKNLSVHEIFSSDGIISFQKKNSETLLLTRTPEEDWLRVWVPLDAHDPYTVRDLLRKYDGLQHLSGEEIATLPIQIGGVKARDLMERAVYFELNLHESGIGYRFPAPSPLVEKFASNSYGQAPVQPELLS